MLLKSRKTITKGYGTHENSISKEYIQYLYAVVQYFKNIHYSCVSYWLMNYKKK